MLYEAQNLGGKLQVSVFEIPGNLSCPLYLNVKICL